MNKLKYNRNKLILGAIRWFIVGVVSCSMYELATYFLNQKDDIFNIVGMAILIALILGLLITVLDTIKKWKVKN